MASIYLSPSTQENNKGAGNYGTEEKRMNEIADITEKELKRHGVTVYRNSPNMSLTQVVADSNSKKPDLHFAIHSNAGGGRGCEVFCYKFGSTGEAFAKSIYNNLSALTPTKDRGVFQGYNYYGTGKHMYEVTYTNCPSALVEVDFHDSADGAKWIIDNIERIGVLFAKCILIYFNIPYIYINTPTEAKTNTGTEREKAIKTIQSVSNWAEDYIREFDIMQSKGINVFGLINKIAEK